MINLEELNAKIDIILAYIEEQRAKAKTDIFVFEWLDTWYQTYKVPVLKANSLRCIGDTIRLYIKPNLENKPLHQLSPIDLQRCLNAIDSTRMAEYSHNTLTDCMRKAYELGYTEKNLMEFVAKPKHVRRKGRALTVEEQTTFLNSIRRVKHWQIFAFYLYSGRRRSEALYLEWSDIDRERQQIHIRGTKTESADRYIPLFNSLKKILRETPKRANKVFAISDSTLKREFEKIRQDCGFQFTIHSLRHTFITRQHERGIDDKAIQKWAGHSNVSTTQKIYIHLTTEHERLQIEKVNQNDPF